MGAGAVALQGSKACRKEKGPPCFPPEGCVVDGPVHCLCVAFTPATSRWAIHSRVLSSGLLPLFEIKPLVFTGPREGLFSCRRGASKVCPGTAGFTWVRRFKKDPLCLGMKRGLGQEGWEGFVFWTVHLQRLAAFHFLSSERRFPSLHAGTQLNFPFTAPSADRPCSGSCSLSKPPQLPLRRQRGKMETEAGGTQRGAHTPNPSLRRHTLSLLGNLGIYHALCLLPVRVPVPLTDSLRTAPISDPAILTQGSKEEWGSLNE